MKTHTLREKEYVKKHGYIEKSLQSDKTMPKTQPQQFRLRSVNISLTSDKKSIEKSLQSVRIPMTNSQRQKKFRDNKKNIQQSEPLNLARYDISFPEE